MIIKNESIKTHVKLCYIDTDSFIVQVKTRNIYIDIAEDVEKNDEVEKPLLMKRN